MPTKKEKGNLGPQNTDVKQMFNDIAPKYDFLNHFLSAGIDKSWRRKTVAAIKPYKPKIILDVATGTGDLAIQLLALNPETITGIDISTQMMAHAKEKVKAINEEKRIRFIEASAENIPFENNIFDAVTVAFGVRNFADLNKGLSELYRIIQPSGIAAILEFSMPQKFPLKQFFTLYFKLFLPLIGKIVSKSASAYKYLPQTISTFPQGEAFAETLLLSGFQKVSYKRLSFGIATLYLAEK